MRGCPVLTTNTTPWNGLEELGAGWNVELNKEKYVEIITDIINSAQIKDNFNDYIDSIVSMKKIKEKNLILFN